MNEEQQKLVNEIMDWFDFEKVHRTMKFLRWKWDSSEEGIPCIGEIRESSRRLLTQAVLNNTNTSSGGLVVTYEPNENYLRLQFVISEWESI